MTKTEADDTERTEEGTGASSKPRICVSLQHLLVAPSAITDFPHPALCRAQQDRAERGFNVPETRAGAGG